MSFDVKQYFSKHYGMICAYICGLKNDSSMLLYLENI